MAWQIRSLDDASAAVRGAFRQWLKGTDTSLKNNFVTVAGKVFAMITDEFERRLAWLVKQMSLSTATDIEWVKLHCGDIDIFQKPASASSGRIVGTGTADRIYPAGISFSSGGLSWIATAPAQASPLGEVVFQVECTSAGAATNRDAGGLLALDDPATWSDLSEEFTVGSDGLGGGADIEDIEDLKARGLYRKRNPRGAGKLSDYEDAVRAVSGVLKAWAFRDPAAPGSVFVFFLFAGRPNLIPSSGDVIVVQAAINAMRFVRVDASEAVAPTPQALDIEISGLSGDTTAIRSAIESGLKAMLYEKARPGIASDAFTLSLSWINEVISGVTGEDRHVLESPLNDITYTNGRYPVLGTVSYT